MKSKMLFFAMIFALLLPSTMFASDTSNLCNHQSFPPHTLINPSIDDGIHYDVVNGRYSHQFEEWYWNGNFTSESGNLYGIEALFFQFSFDIAPGFPQFVITFAQLSLTDESNNTYETNFITEFHFDGQGFPVLPGSYDMTLTSGAGAHLAAVGGGGSDVLEFVYEDGTEVVLNVDSLKNPVPGFFDGLGNYRDPVTGESHGQQFYYNRQLETFNGYIITPGGPLEAVEGEGWQDRQYGTVIGTPGTTEDNVNWTWYSIRLDDGSTYHMWDMSARDTGNSLMHVVNSSSSDPQCIDKTTEHFTIGSSGSFASPNAPDSFFPEEYTLDIPAHQVHLTMTPVVLDQVITTDLFEPTYEGLAYVTGEKEGQPVTGFAYVEVTGGVGCCQSNP